MDTSRASGTYATRISSPPTTQQHYESFPQRRNSYRRPVDARPQSQDANMATVIPSNTARPVASSAANGMSRSSSHRRRQSQQVSPTIGAMVEPMPAAPDVPRAPPTAYKDPYAQKLGSQGPPRSSSRDPPIQMNASRQQPTIKTAAGRLYELRSPPYAPVEPLSGTVERRGSKRKPSVPDRSPLQKLEGKLDDISKEERRARMLEAELAAQERVEAEMRARRAREAAEKEKRLAAQPVATYETVPDTTGRTGNGKRHVSQPTYERAPDAAQRAEFNKRQVSAPLRSHPRSPDISDLESEGDYVYDLSEPWDPSAAQAVAVPVAQRVPSQKQPRLTSISKVPQTDPYIPRRPSTKGKEPVGTSGAVGTFRERTVPSSTPITSTAPAVQQVHRKPVEHPIGSLTPLSGLGLEDAGIDDTLGGAEVMRSDSRRFSKDSLIQQPLRQGSQRDSRGIMAARMEMQQQQINQKGLPQSNGQFQVHPYDSPVPPVARKSVGFSDIDSEIQPQAPHEHHRFSRHHGPERTYIKPPMLEEWRQAPVASLVAEDFDLTAPTRTPNATNNKAWWEESQAGRRQRSGTYAEPPSAYDGYADEPTSQTSFNPPLYLKCGPLLRYTGMRRDQSRTGHDREIWRGSVLIVTTDAESSYQKPPSLRLFKQTMDILPPPPQEVQGDELDPAYTDPVEGQFKVSRTGQTMYVKPVHEIAENEDLSRVEDETGLFSLVRSATESGSVRSRIHKKDGEKLGKVREIPGVRLHAERGVTFWRFNLEVELGSTQARIAYRINNGPAIGFWVPAKGETMNIMFHSCNGFSMSVNSKEFCGPDPMWRDVLNSHQSRPFHVMLGGGDQIYNDAAMRDTTLFRQWTENRNPVDKHHTPFSEELQNELEQFYLDRYSMWFSQGLFGMANSQIPMVNIWDDHDIIDGYGSYPHHFMQTPVFTGIGAVAFKYYMLFQHQSVPAETEQTEPSWVLGKSPGPYIKERSRSVFMHLGRQLAFLGLDCRTERQRDEILTEDSYDVIFDRLEDEIIKGETKHLIVLLGVPIAYPRLNFLENILTSRMMDPIKAMGRAGLLGGFVNKFDGGVEILDDLDDHWTAKHHKEERNWFIKELQHIAETKSVRVTILGGDVHLGAVGQFYSNKKLKIPKDKDARYMPNVISSAIVNTPPPDMMADILNKRNKVHHLDANTDEDMIPIFTHGVDGKKRNNNHLLPHRNWCSIREYKPGLSPPGTPEPEERPQLGRRLSDTLNPRQMVRRFSSDQGRQPSTRGRGPPLSYYNNPQNATADELQTNVHNHPQSSFSPDRSETERPTRSRRNSLTSLFRRRPSVDNADRRGSAQSLPPTQVRNDGSFERPSEFRRRPSVLTKNGFQQKKKGDFIDLQGSLDISLNMEVSQHDPAGITTPYRLLVPTLNYTPPEPGTAAKQPRKGSFLGIFGGGRRKRRTIGDDGYSQSGSESESGSEIGEMSEDDEEERARQRYRVGPRIIIPGFGSRNKRSTSANQAPPPDNRLSSGFHANGALTDHTLVAGDSRDVVAGHRQSVDGESAQQGRKGSAWEAVGGKRHSSAPNTGPAPQTAPLPPMSSGSLRKTPTHNSSHKSQLPEPQSPEVHRRSMGGILNQHGNDKFEHDAHVLAHTPSKSKRDSYKRESYPPHPAIVGAGPDSPYNYRGGMQARDDTAGGDYFSSGGRHSRPTSQARPVSNGQYAHPSRTAPAPPPAQSSALEPAPERAVYAERSGYDRTSYPAYPSRNGNAGVGARYLGDGRYEDDSYDSVDEDERSYSGEEQQMSQESFVPPKPKKKWQIWRLIEPTDDWWQTQLHKFPVGYTACRALVSERIPKVPRCVSDKIVDLFCAGNDSLAAFVKTNDDDDACLIRPYLGRRRRHRQDGPSTSRFQRFSLRNVPLHVDQMEVLGLDTHAYAETMADALALMHWGARIDANDVEC
ncbi:hypothetical protein E8E13_005618 [Curvularia kusanoi]|uniref:PhoD-like phosphatase domain-containing protein n=1 Tax=Curvularia kusanoi TaxID=90978 RepID=A0A9P4WBQ9_CURKU|nr:hypothetical protein E8E13_005618 [Curvularia kusanoi]